MKYSKEAKKVKEKWKELGICEVGCADGGEEGQESCWHAVSSLTIQSRGPWPPMASEHVKCGWCKLRCALSMKQTTDSKTSNENKNVNDLINHVYVDYTLE